MKPADRVGRYFEKYIKGFAFCELSAGYLKKAGVFDIMNGVPVPLGKEGLAESGGGVPLARLAENMCMVIGSDPDFTYAQNYADFLTGLYGDKVCEGIIKEGERAALSGDFGMACVFFRAALRFSPGHLSAMYGYAKACREMYLLSEDEECTGRFKAESMSVFESLAEVHPEFAGSYYYLGYAYLNAGLYLKAELTWREFLKRGGDLDEMEEIKERLAKIAEPVEIERGYNMALSGRFAQGLEILEPFLETQFKTWWPLSYYLGICYRGLSQNDKALLSFKNVLTMNASHVATMEELADLYAKAGDHESGEKYRKKIEILLDGPARV